MQIDNDMLKADLEEKDEEIAQLRARVATAAVTAPPSPSPAPSPIPAPTPVPSSSPSFEPSQSTPIVQDNSLVLQEIENLKKGMVKYNECNELVYNDFLPVTFLCRSPSKLSSLNISNNAPTSHLHNPTSNLYPALYHPLFHHQQHLHHHNQT